MSPRTWTLELPFDRPPLSLNARQHHMAVYRIRQQIIEAVHWQAIAQRLPKNLDHVGIVLHWQATVKRSRDTDNPAPTLKACIDALAGGRGKRRGYGLVVDDDSEHVTSGVVIEQLAAEPRMWLEIHDLSAVPANPNGAGETK